MFDTKNQRPLRIAEGYIAPADEELQELYGEKSLSVAEVGKHYNVCRETAAKWLKDAEMRNPGIFEYHKYHEKRPDPETLRRLYVDEGKTCAKIAEIYGVAHSTVSYWIDCARKQGLDFSVNHNKGRHSTRPDDDTLHRLLYDEGKSITDISTMFNVSKGTVSHWITAARKRDQNRYWYKYHK